MYAMHHADVRSFLDRTSEKKKGPKKKNGVCEENSRNPTYEFVRFDRTNRTSARCIAYTKAISVFGYVRFVRFVYCPMVIFFSKILILSHFIAKHGRQRSQFKECGGSLICNMEDNAHNVRSVEVLQFMNIVE